MILVFFIACIAIMIADEYRTNRNYRRKINNLFKNAKEED